MLGHSAMVPYDGLAAWIQFHAGGHMAYRRDWKAWLRLAHCQMLTSMKTAAWSDAAWLELVMAG